MPQFSPGETRTAVAPITAKPSGISCEAELFLGPNDATKVASSGRIPFVSAGAAKNVSLPITMPSAPGSYHGYIDVLAEGLRFLTYILKEDVVIVSEEGIRVFTPPPELTGKLLQAYELVEKLYVALLTDYGGDYYGQAWKELPEFKELESLISYGDAWRQVSYRMQWPSLPDAEDVYNKCWLAWQRDLQLYGYITYDTAMLFVRYIQSGQG